MIKLDTKVNLIENAKFNTKNEMVFVPLLTGVQEELTTTGVNMINDAFSKGLVMVFIGHQARLFCFTMPIKSLTFKPTDTSINSFRLLIQTELKEYLTYTAEYLKWCPSHAKVHLVGEKMVAIS